MFRSTYLRCWSTEGVWCCQRRGDDDHDYDYSDDDYSDDNYDDDDCDDDDNYYDYYDDYYDYYDDDDNVDTLQVVSINCSVSANPSTDLVFR